MPRGSNKGGEDSEVLGDTCREIVDDPRRKLLPLVGLTTRGTIFCSVPEIDGASFIDSYQYAAVNHRIQALSFSKEIFGDGSIEMVPPYLLLSEANLGLGLLRSAEEFLSMANWSILKTPDCSNAIRSQVCTFYA